MTARKLIEEAQKMMADNTHICPSDSTCTLCRPYHILTEALSLLPEWQEFDPKREETWPKPKEMPEWFLVCRSDCGVSWDTWGYQGWESDEDGLTLAWMPLPPPYVKP